MRVLCATWVLHTHALIVEEALNLLFQVVPGTMFVNVFYSDTLPSRLFFDFAGIRAIVPILISTCTDVA